MNTIVFGLEGEVANGFGASRDVKSNGCDMSKPWNLKEEDDDKVVFDTSGDMLVSFDNSVENVQRRRCLRRKRKRSLGLSKVKAYNFASCF